MIETYGSLMVLMFQENRFFWASEDLEKGAVRCNFCGAYGERPDTLDHLSFCVIEMAMMAIANDSELQLRIKNGPKRPVLNFNIELTVFKGGDRTRRKTVHN